MFGQRRGIRGVEAGMLAGLIMVSVHLGPGATWAGPAFWLITPEEAAMAPAPGPSPGGVPTEVGREESELGPLIDVVKPMAGDRQSPPLEIVVRFAPRVEPVDLSSLKVVVVKFIAIDITDRVRPYATPAGIQINEAQIPSGKHIVRISLGDRVGGLSVKEVSFEVL